MKRKQQQPQTLQEAIRYFSDEQTCIDAVAALRWPGGKPVCPACEHTEHYWLASQRRWKCKECYKQFTVKLGTIFEDSALSLTKWLPALWMLVNCKNGISSYELASDLGISQKSAWFMLHRLRLALQTGFTTKLGGPGREVEADETFVGGKAEFMHKDRKRRIMEARSEIRNSDATGHPGKTPVMGILDRETRQMRAKVVPNVRRETLQTEILNHVEHGTSLYTDDAGGYRYLPQEKFVHEVVDHAQTYVRGRVHTNGLENFWSLLKRGLRGTYVAVEPFHLFRYVDEQVFRFNNRKDAAGNRMSDAERFGLALSQVAGKRLTFAEVTGKVGETSF